MMRVAKSGFTLIELAIVVAIIAILAAVAIPRMSSSTEAAERSMAQDMRAKLMSAAAVYTARMAQTPQSFDEFVTDNDADLSADPSGDTFYTLSTASFGPRADHRCSAAAGTTLNCSGVFRAYPDVQYTYHPESGAIDVAGLEDN